MKTIEQQLEIIHSLIGENDNIKIKEDGFLSRGFVIDNGRLVIKFPRRQDVDYKTEIDNLNYINLLDLGISLQKVAFTSQTNEYLGVYGVLGSSLERLTLNQKEQKQVGEKLGKFLKKLHSVTNHTGKPCLPKDEIEAWQSRVKFIDDFLTQTFSKEEKQIIDKLMFDYLPNKLNKLGEKLVFSHGDLGDGNIFVDENEDVGVIDFNESGLLDEAADFMDVSSDVIRDSMLLAYGADETLKEKVELRRDIRPLIVLKPYLIRGEESVISNLVTSVKATVAKYSFLISK